MARRERDENSRFNWSAELRKPGVRLTLLIGMVATTIPTILFAGLNHLLGGQNSQWPLASIVVTTLVLLSAWIAYQNGKAQLRMQESVDALAVNVTQVEWTKDSDAHDVHVYRKMTRLIEDPSTSEFNVLTIFKPRSEPKGEALEAVKDYYRAIEKALSGREFMYRRAVVLRKDFVGLDERPADPLHYFVQRPEFKKHHDAIHLGRDRHRKHNSQGKIKIFFDEGRLLDIAFALFYRRVGGVSKVSSLVLEIAVIGETPDEKVMGLLSLENPKEALVDSLRHAFFNLFDREIVKQIKLEDILKNASP